MPICPSSAALSCAKQCHVSPLQLITIPSSCLARDVWTTQVCQICLRCAVCQKRCGSHSDRVYIRQSSLSKPALGCLFIQALCKCHKESNWLASLMPAPAALALRSHQSDVSSLCQARFGLPPASLRNSEISGSGCSVCLPACAPAAAHASNVSVHVLCTKRSRVTS